MLTETISGKCPACNYDKLFQRYGSIGYFQMDFCPRCGFAYGSNHYDGEKFGEDAWVDYAQYMLSMIDEKLSEEDIKKMSNLELRKRIYEYCESTDRSDDMPMTVFKYTEDDVKKHLATNQVIFGGDNV